MSLDLQISMSFMGAVTCSLCFSCLRRSSVGSSFFPEATCLLLHRKLLLSVSLRLSPTYSGSDPLESLRKKLASFYWCWLSRMRRHLYIPLILPFSGLHVNCSFSHSSYDSPFSPLYLVPFYMDMFQFCHCPY